MKWDTDDLLRMFLSGGILTGGVTIVGRIMGWVRFGKTDEAKIRKVNSETAIDLAVITEKRISNEVKISDAALQWAVNLSSQLEKANKMIDVKQIENDRLHGIIDIMKKDFEKAFRELREEFTKRVKDLEEKLELSREELIEERTVNWHEIEKLKSQIDGNR